MNRKKFEGLPEQARQIIRKFSGEWTAERYIETYRAENEAALESLKQDPNRKVVVPSPTDLARANAVFRAEVDSLVGNRPASSRIAGQGRGGAQQNTRRTQQASDEIARQHIIAAWGCHAGDGALLS